MNVRVMLSGRNYHLADSLPQQLTLPEGATVDDALRALTGMLPGDEPLPGTCLIAVSGVHLGTVGRHPSRALRDDDELVVIAPVAGG
jgi:molybdopterin converting factor small subunit